MLKATKNDFERKLVYGRVFPPFSHHGNPKNDKNNANISGGQIILSFVGEKGK